MKTLNEILGPRVTKDLTVHVKDILKPSGFRKMTFRKRMSKPKLAVKNTREEHIFSEDLRKWFREKWVRMDTKGNIKGDCAREPGEGKPKCLPLLKARAMDKEKRAAAAKRKRRQDPVADRKGKGEAPINVRTEQMENLEEKNTPTNPQLWSKAKALAKSKFDVYPSAYANGWAAKWYKSKGGGWKAG